MLNLIVFIYVCVCVCVYSEERTNEISWMDEHGRSFVDSVESFNVWNIHTSDQHS